MTRFDQLLAQLTRNRVNYIVVGGLAANLHGSARLTQDLDILYERCPENLQRMVDALADLKPYLRGAPPGLPFRWDVRTLQAGLNFTLVTQAGDLDLLGTMAGPGTYEQVAKRAEEVEVFDLRIQVLSLEDLIWAKRAAGRPKDLEVLAELEALRDDDSHSV